jgi:hypothetical protein
MADRRLRDRFTDNFFGQIPQAVPVIPKGTGVKEILAAIQSMAMPALNAQQNLPSDFFEGKTPLDPAVSDVARDYGPRGELAGTVLPAGYASHPTTGRIYAVNEETDRMSPLSSSAQLVAGSLLDPLRGAGTAVTAAQRLGSPIDPTVLATGVPPPTIPRPVRKLWKGYSEKEKQHLARLAQLQAKGELTGPPTSGPQTGPNWFPGAKTEMATPLDVLDAQRKTVPHATNVPMAPVTPLAWPDLQGKTIVPLVGDRTQAGVDLTEMGGQTLPTPLHLEGGMDYMRGPAAWASERKTMAGLANRLPEIKDPVGVYTPMGGTAGDYALMTIDALHRVWSPKMMTKAGRDAVNKRIKSGIGIHNRIGKKGYPDAPPIGTKKFMDRIRTDGNLRKAYIQALDKASARREGAPDIGMVRHGITDPYLRNLPDPTARIYNQQMMGGGVTDLSPTGEMRPGTHGTYDTDLMPGPQGYMGRADPLLPRDLVMRDFTRALQERGGLPKAAMRSMLTGPALFPQAVDQELIDAFGGYDLLLKNLK